MDKAKVGLVLATVGVIYVIVSLSGNKESSSDYQHHSYKRSTSSTYSSGSGSTSYSGTSGKTSTGTHTSSSGTSSSTRKSICGKDGCQREQGNNGTVFCDTHAAQYAREKGYKVCFKSGCYGSRGSKGKYCSKHTCKCSKCMNGVVDGTSYCSTHTTTTSGTSKQTTNSSSKSSSKSSYKSYDKGYEDVYEDDDYDLDRYNSDSDYASGVDDAIDDYEEEEGEDW